MKVLVCAFNQEKALVGAFSVIVKTDCETDGSFYSTGPGVQVSGGCRVSAPRRPLLPPDLCIIRSWEGNCVKIIQFGRDHYYKSQYSDSRVVKLNFTMSGEGL